MSELSQPASQSDSDHILSLENRILQLENQIQQLQTRVTVQNRNADGVAGTLPNTALISPSFFTRAFAVWGHMIAAQLMITIPLYCIIFALSVLGSSGR